MPRPEKGTAKALVTYRKMRFYLWVVYVSCMHNQSGGKPTMQSHFSSVIASFHSVPLSLSRLA